MPIPDGTKIGVSTETPSLYFDSFLIAFVVSIKTCNDSDVIFPKTILTFLYIYKAHNEAYKLGTAK